LKLFQSSISHVITSETEVKLFQPPKDRVLKLSLGLFQNYFSYNEHVGKYP